MRLKFTIITLLLLLFTGSSYLHAQKEKKNKKKKAWLLKDFRPDESTYLLRKPDLSFPNINRIAFYYNPKELAIIKQLADNKDYNHLLPALVQYVENFGILNFSKDLDILWFLARVAEHEENWALAKEVWRIIIKHHRGDSWLSMKYHDPNKPINWSEIQSESLQAAILHYDSLTKFEKNLYVELEFYYKLVELRSTIDTLQPPKSVLLDMGEMINSPHEDYGMTISGFNDDKILFTSNRLTGTNGRITNDLGGRISEDIFYATRDEDGIWGEAEPLTDINTRYKEGSPCMNRAGDVIIFSRCFSPDGIWQLRPLLHTKD